MDNIINFITFPESKKKNQSKIKSRIVKLSFIVILLHVGTYSGTKCRASQDHGATQIQGYNNEVKKNTSINLYTINLLTDFD